MQSRLDRVDAEHAPAYLESSKAENVPYYQRFGFEVTGEIIAARWRPDVVADVAAAALNTDPGHGFVRATSRRSTQPLTQP